MRSGRYRTPAAANRLGSASRDSIPKPDHARSRTAALVAAESMPVPREAPMPIPTYDQLLRPLLALAATQDLTRKNAAGIIADQFNLTADERESRIPSGQSTYIRNRVGW